MYELPQHLKKYCVDQNYARYTPLDQATWRYCLRQLKDFLSKNAHPVYIEGLEKTGISAEQIPRIEEMSAKLKNFGWTAMPVSGFIPPAAFMELQSLSILPIASDMRSIDHLLYTPAPDIVHEAAGHAPIIVDPEYAAYLKDYAQVAKKAIISKEDLDLYEAIRELSDIKESPASTEEQISASEKRLETTIKASTHVSEASELSRMNWWTAEYGLVGSVDNPKIFGAGLLSSVGESKWCLSEKVKKIPLTVDCIKQTYDITEPQPQLFVTPDFKTLVKVLHQMAETMAYRIGGKTGLDKAIQAKSVNTVELETGLQISGVLTEYLTSSAGEVIYIKFTGPTQISRNDQQLAGHNKEYHQHGYSFPLGKFSQVGHTLQYDSGVTVTGDLVKTEHGIMTFTNCTVKYQDQTLFQPDWGNFDITVGNKVVSVFGGAADRKSYGDTNDFVAARVPTPNYSSEQKAIFALYQDIRDYRRNGTEWSDSTTMALFDKCLNQASDQWLLFVELLEIALMSKISPVLTNKIEAHLQTIKSNNEKLTSVIDDGVRLAYA
ncbi:MAG: aromatic amino acid hydroxylase [Bdellovibrionota bacterium]